MNPPATLTAGKPWAEIGKKNEFTENVLGRKSVKGSLWTEESVDPTIAYWLS
jgi:hypothetical protein